MLKSKEVYEFICKGINRKDKFDEFETLFGQPKNDTTEDTVNIKDYNMGNLLLVNCIKVYIDKEIISIQSISSLFTHKVAIDIMKL